ncbi:uncharacterized protein N7484_009176 [Penicillium longicatenatum]|uniref:uncharacterized protein n=1 Tax=Penicillium longicatenatum TaxID=1561947 RepID=UPI0025490804|nr:uncharacterized protein N7484_009176 [Penicillium longicatenatum]KAJ5635863.1 hypothetical protein N7484_009176 [Penicillium longicatenatum]
MAHIFSSMPPANTHAFFSGIVILDVAPENTSAGQYGIPLTIDYNNRGRHEFPPGTIAFVQGVLSVDPTQATNADPKVLIRADQLVPMQGNPDSSGYEKHTPFMANGSLTFIGTLINSRIESGHRLFVLIITVFNIENTRNKDALKYSTFKVVCMVPDGSRWSNFRTPSYGSLMQASGDWMGYYEVDGVRCPCIVASAFSFIRTANSPIFPWLQKMESAVVPSV